MIADRLRMIQAVSGGGGGFDPTTYPGLLRWYSASDVVLSGSNIAQINDKSGNGNHATQATSTKQPLITYLPSGTVVSFDGVDDIINFAAMTLTGDFTIYWAGWMRETGGAHAGFFGEAEASLNSLNTFRQGTYWYNNGDIVQGNDGRIATGNFYIVTATRTGTTIKCEVNAVDNSSQPANTNPTIGQIGRAYSGYSQHDLGEFLVYNQYHDAATRQAFRDWIYSNYNMTSLLLNMQGTAGGTTFIDESPNAFTVTRVGDTVLVSDATFGTAASFDGAGDYLSISSNAAFNFGTGDFTVEAWINPALSTGVTGVCATSGGSGGTSKFVVHLNNRVPSIHYQGLTNGSNLYTTSTAAVAQSQWSHIAFCRAGATWKWFINGVQSGSGTNATNIIFTTQPSYIGYGGESYFTPFNGKIGPLRITKGFARYTANFTPPTGKFPTS